MITLDSRLRLRASCAMVPQGDQHWQFFLGNTRRTRRYRIQDNLAAAVKLLDGKQSLSAVAEAAEVPPAQLSALARALHAACVVEDAFYADQSSRSPWRRLVNMLGDFIPSDELEGALARLRNTTVVVLGVGAVGSWVARQLAQSAIGHLVLVDEDCVEPSNLNRSLYLQADIGSPKVDAMARQLAEIQPSTTVTPVRKSMSEEQELKQLLARTAGSCLVVNCADMPSVDATSSMVNAACMSLRTPYVIAGGYNLHLSLIGMTVLPGRSACYECGRMTLQENQSEDLAGMRKLARPWRNIGNLAPLAAITSSFAAMEVVRVALDDPRLGPAMVNRRGEFNFLTNQMHFVDLPPRDECGCCNALTLDKSRGGP